MREYRDSSNRLSIELSATTSSEEFDRFASCLQSECNACLVKKVTGLDQIYWDFDLPGVPLVLHMDAFTGICIFVNDGSNDDILRDIGRKLLKEQ